MHDLWHYWPKKKNYQCDSNFFTDNLLYEILTSVLFRYFVDRDVCKNWFTFNTDKTQITWLLVSLSDCSFKNIYKYMTTGMIDWLIDSHTIDSVRFKF